MDDIKDRLQAFVKGRKLGIVRRIGFGIHGQVFAVRGATPFLSVVKVFEAIEPYRRERNVFLRLQDAQVLMVEGCAVPALIEYSDSRLAIWMTMVTRPFCLDFAAAFLDEIPSDFPPTDAAWLAEKREQFEEDWDKVSRVLEKLKSMGIIQTDVSPTNISV